MLALARNIPQAHASADRRQVGALEVRRRRGLREDARHPRLRPHRPARGRPRARLRHARRSPSTRSCPPSASASSASRRPRRRADVYARGRLHHDPPAQDAGDARLARRRGVRADEGRRAGHQLRARRAASSTRRCKDALDSGKVAGAALDVFPAEPITDYPLFDGYANVVVTPHLGASTTEAQDRAGVQTAEQVVAALTGGVVSTAVNIPAVSAEDMEVLGPVPAARAAARPPRHRARRGRQRRARRGRVPRAASPSATRACSRSPCSGRARRPHRGGGQPRQRALAGRGARDRGRPRRKRGRGARLHRPRARHLGRRRARAWSAPRSASATARTCSRPGASASTSSSTTTTSRCSATPTCPAWSAASAPCFGEHGHQHLPGRRRPRAPGRGRPPRRRRRDGGHHRRAGAAVGGRRDRRRATASSPAARSRFSQRVATGSVGADQPLRTRARSRPASSITAPAAAGQIVQFQ